MFGEVTDRCTGVEDSLSIDADIPDFANNVTNFFNLVSNVHYRWKKACGGTQVTKQLAALKTLLSRVEAEARSPQSLFARNPKHLEWWNNFSKECHDTIANLEKVLEKHKDLGRNPKRNWERIQRKEENVSDLLQILKRKRSELKDQLVLLGINSQGRVEHETLPNIFKKIVEITRILIPHLAGTNRSIMDTLHLSIQIDIGVTVRISPSTHLTPHPGILIRIIHKPLPGSELALLTIPNSTVKTQTRLGVQHVHLRRLDSLSVTSPARNADSSPGRSCLNRNCIH